MRTFLGVVLSVIAVGVLLVAYGLLKPRAVAADDFGVARPIYASDRVTVLDDPARMGRSFVVQNGVAYPVSTAADVRPVPVSDVYAAPAPRRASVVRPVSYQERPVRAERSSGRDWKKTAMVIGGSSAAGAGVGAIFGGKKVSLIGAAIGGGAGTLYEVRKR